MIVKCLICGKKRNRMLMKSALHEAVQSMEALIDAHRTAYSKRRDSSGHIVMVVSKENRGFVATWKRQIKAWKKLWMQIEKGE